MSKVGRNDPCPCGSGQKYKKCCIAKSYSPPGRDEGTKESIVQDLLALFMRRFDREKFAGAVSRFWGDNDMALPAEYEQMAEVNLWEWIVHDWADADTGKSLIDLYIEERRVIPVEHMAVLKKMKGSVLSVLEVQEVLPEKGIVVKDLLLGGEYDVREKAATAQLRRWDIFGARVMELDGQVILAGSAYPFSIMWKKELLDNLHGIYTLYHEDNPSDDMRAFLKKNGEAINHQWLDMITAPRGLKISTTDGEAMIVSKAHFILGNAEKARKALGRHKDMEPDDEGGYVWLGKRDRRGGATIFGWIKIAQDGMTLECHSRERLERGKTLIVKLLPDARHKADSFEALGKMLESWGSAPGQEFTVPLEIEQELYEQHMDRHYRKWLTASLPALGGKTPCQAMRSKKGKEQVRELLKMFENQEEHNKSANRPYYDFTWMWKELGLTRD